MTDEDEVPTAPVWVWIGLSLIAAISFWCQAIVTEERLVPALNVIADYYNIPDDIAGATLMAAGASSPELFSSFVALFITHSSLGLGTIVGSEIFNQLVICAGSVYASKTGKLQLDRAVVTREVGFYALGIVLLYFALQDVGPVDDDPDGPDHIFISFREACMVFGGYIAYVLVCANMDSVVSLFSTAHKRIRSISVGSYYGAINTSRVNLEVPTMPFIIEKKALSKEPSTNWDAVTYYTPTEIGRESIVQEGNLSERSAKEGSLQLKNFLSASFRNTVQSIRHESILHLIKHSERPTELHAVHDVEINEYTSTFRCFLWQRSIFYTKAYFGSHGWHLRWFTITPEKVISVPDRHDPEDHTITYPKFNHIDIDDDRMIIQIVHPDAKKRNFTLMAPSKPIFDKVVEAFQRYMEAQSTNQKDETQTDIVDLEDEGKNIMDTDIHVELIEFPSDGTNFEVAMWIFLSPLRLVMHYTLPDVRSMDKNGEPTSTIYKAYFATFMCLVWLIIGSYAMVASLENLAELMNIPDSVIGFTVSAAGTSLPNYVASKVAAENGFGNQAVSNAFGSNTFNIMVGLGLPWVLYISLGNGFKPYDGLEAQGILESIIILAVVLLIFVVLMLKTGFVIYKWHGHLYIGLYVAYIAFAVGQVYVGK